MVLSPIAGILLFRKYLEEKKASEWVDTALLYGVVAGLVAGFLCVLCCLRREDCERMVCEYDEEEAYIPTVRLHSTVQAEERMSLISEPSTPTCSRYLEL